MNSNRLRQLLAITRKELDGYFSSPPALIFLGVFLATTLFVFFWVETFFARNIADVRPMFSWMPTLLIFLVATLTMKQWSEEQKSGTLEILLTLPVPRVYLVLGKFIAVLILVAVALALTIFLPISVAIIGDLDWGPVVGGYIATILMVSVYISIGLLVSSRTESQIIALIITVLICGLFNVIGGRYVIGAFADNISTVMAAVDVGVRFDSIERGVIDLRDLLFYVSLTVVFILGNVISIDSKRWGKSSETKVYKRNVWLAFGLIGLNLILLNIILSPCNNLRLDITSDSEYSLTDTTKDLISTLEDPVIIRAYFSDKTHPMLEPLIPTIKDILSEYKTISGNNVSVKILDPSKDEQLEFEARRSYGVDPTPISITERYESSVVNAYFDIVIVYGDQFERLGISDLVRIEKSADGEVETRLRNIEYDVTRSIKKVVAAFERGDAIYADLKDNIILTAYITEDNIPPQLNETIAWTYNVGNQLVEESLGKVAFNVLDPDNNDFQIDRATIKDIYGLDAIDSIDGSSYYLYAILEYQDTSYLIYPGEDISQEDLRASFDTGIRKIIPGSLKQIGGWQPPVERIQNPFNPQMAPMTSWYMLLQHLSENYYVRNVDLLTGIPPMEVDVLLVLSPEQMRQSELLALDQFIMRGGPVVIAAGSYLVSPLQIVPGLNIRKVDGGIHDLIEHYGVKMGRNLVLDSQNEPFPIQVQKDVSDVVVMDIENIDYPFFVDVRSSGLNRDNPVASNIPSLTMHWASPLYKVSTKSNVEIDAFISSSKESWLRESIDVRPDMEIYPEIGFPIEGEQMSRDIAMTIHGKFNSYFSENELKFTDADRPDTDIQMFDTSPGDTRVVVFGSGDFINDTFLELSQTMSEQRYISNLQFVQNAIDWAVKDEGLLKLRGRTIYVRLLDPMSDSQQQFWEYINYGVMIIGLFLIAGLWYLKKRSEKPNYNLDLESKT